MGDQTNRIEQRIILIEQHINKILEAIDYYYNPENGEYEDLTTQKTEGISVKEKEIEE